MKKVTKLSLLGGALALILSFGMISCSDSDDDDDSSSQTEQTVNNSSTEDASSDNGGSENQTTTSTGVWNFENRTAAPTGANAWDAKTELTSDVTIASDSGTGTFTVLKGVKAKYNNGLQFSASKTSTSKNSVSSLKNNFTVDGKGKITFKLKVVTASADYAADGGQKTGIALSADVEDSELLDGSTSGTIYTKSFDIDGETKFYIGNLKILEASFE